MKNNAVVLRINAYTKPIFAVEPFCIISRNIICSRDIHSTTTSPCTFNEFPMSLKKIMHFANKIIHLKFEFGRKKSCTYNTVSRL